MTDQEYASQIKEMAKRMSDLGFIGTRLFGSVSCAVVHVSTKRSWMFTMEQETPIGVSCSEFVLAEHHAYMEDTCQL